jgi:hypothetical protein
MHVGQQLAGATPAVKPLTPRRAAAERIYRKRRALFLEANPRCAFPGGCVNAAQDVHHKRGRVGADLLDESRWLACCRSHHDWIGLHPSAAYEMGVSERRIGRTG